MNHELAVEAVILNYRHSELTARCIESLSGQVRRVWVVDNSHDDEQHEDLVKKTLVLSEIVKDLPVEILNPGKNLGFATGVQFGIDQALANDDDKWILLINNDAIASDGMIEQMAGEMNARGGTALVAPREAAKGETPSLLWYHRAFALLSTRPVPGAFAYLTGACLLVPAKLARPFLFDPDFFMYGEDVELSWRMTQAGVPLVVSDAEFKHTGSASSRIGSLFYEYHVARGHILLAQKLATGFQDRITLLTGRVISLSLRALTRCIRYRSLTPAYALIRAWLGIAPLPPAA